MIQGFLRKLPKTNDVDRYHSGAVCPCGTGFAKRFDRHRVGFARAVRITALACGAPAQVADAVHCRGDPVSAARGPSMADELAAVTRAVAMDVGAVIVDMNVLGTEHNACSRSPWTDGWGGNRTVSVPTIGDRRAGYSRRHHRCCLSLGLLSSARATLRALQIHRKIL